MFTFRLIEEKDYPLWKEMYADYLTGFGRRFDEERYQRLLVLYNDPSMRMFRIIAADSETNQMRAFAHYILSPCFYTAKFTCYLQDLYVHPSVRNQGVAKQLINYLAQKAKTQDWRNVYWKTYPNNSAAISLYEKISERNECLFYEIKS
jgi:GNAT superfamily N-acetyltransferase